MNERKQIISEFAGMTIDMDYMLCIPSIHAKYMEEDIIMDYSGGIREKSDAFPEEKVKLLIEWVKLHKDEIEQNHARCGQNAFPLVSIAPL